MHRVGKGGNKGEGRVKKKKQDSRQTYYCKKQSTYKPKVIKRRFHRRALLPHNGDNVETKIRKTQRVIMVPIIKTMEVMDKALRDHSTGNGTLHVEAEKVTGLVMMTLMALLMMINRILKSK